LVQFGTHTNDEEPLIEWRLLRKALSWCWKKLWISIFYVNSLWT